ncbi:unnamed protein product [Leptidea sinapis]|uniref:Uncharacterized protein n=1 Tax=Leptidea sinapis TaxID=189913 RepID=A0A5E4PQI2_9NEOP|nr:unnamed protein product [Leptidea sinapis]
MAVSRRVLLACVALLAAARGDLNHTVPGDEAQGAGLATSDDALPFIQSLTDEEYYEMPKLFDLDEYRGCMATRGVYCVGSFELLAPRSHVLYRRMQVTMCCICDLYLSVMRCGCVHCFGSYWPR